MRAIVQRVKSANVQIDEQLVAEIESGLLIFLGISIDDQQSDIDYLISKIANLRIFRDDDLRWLFPNSLCMVTVEKVAGQILAKRQNLNKPTSYTKFLLTNYDNWELM